MQEQTDLYDKNLYVYCDGNPNIRFDVGGDLWELAIACEGAVSVGTGASLGSLGSAFLATLGAVAPIVIAVAAVAAVSYGAYHFAKSKNKTKSKELVDPYARPGQKKQGRENKNKSRKNQNFKSRNNRRDNKPAQPKKHTPSRKGHTKYY